MPEPEAPPDAAASPVDPGRVHRYEVRCSWSGSTGVGYEKYERAHVVGAPPAAAALALSSDPAFRGNATLLNPEQLLLMAASSCQLLAFLAVAARARLDVLVYEDRAEAEMPEDDLPVRIKTIRFAAPHRGRGRCAGHRGTGAAVGGTGSPRMLHRKQPEIGRARRADGGVAVGQAAGQAAAAGRQPSADLPVTIPLRGEV